MSYYANNYSEVKLQKSSEIQVGLRNSQLGAVHSIGSYYTLNNNEPALVVMPTGSGKTAVITLAPYIIEAKRALIISSSVLVRGQIFEKIKSLETLKNIGVFGNEVPSPNAFEVTSVLDSKDKWDKCLDFDIVVGTPNSLSPGILNGSTPPQDLFDLILVDEAHHYPAKTWSIVIDNFPNAKKLFFTATPFRRDKKEVKGKIIYNYPISKAYEDGIFGDIGYISIPYEGGDNLTKDTLIAKKAEQVFNEDRAAGFDHYLMVRTKGKKHANELSDLYEENTSLKLKVIHSGHTYRHIKTTVKKLKNKDLDGIICVDMLGEGFDFPNLKIAAIHAPHKSLAVTLQFIGRFARTNAPNIGQAKFIAVENDIIIGQKELYREGKIWNEIIHDLGSRKIEAIQEEREFNENFELITSTNETADNLSLSVFHPSSHLKIYRVQDFDINAKIEIPGQEIVNHYISHSDSVLVFLTKEVNRPKWIKVNGLLDIKYYLYLFYFDRNRKLLFIHSSGKRTQTFYEDLLGFFDVGDYSIIPKTDIHKVLHGLTNLKFFNIGLQTRAASSGESYKIIAGSTAQNSVQASDARMYSNGHIQCTGDSENGKRTIGYSSGSKVWAKSYLPINQYIDLCNSLGSKILSDVKVVTNTSLDLIPIAQSITTLPDNEKVFFIDWNEATFKDHPFIYVNIADNTVYDGRLLELDLEIDYSYYSKDEIRFFLKGENFKIQFSYSFEDGFMCHQSGDYKLIIHFNEDNYTDLLVYLTDNPLVFLLTDFSTLRNHNELIRGGTGLHYDAESLEVIDWGKYETDISEEFNKPKDASKKSIHATLEEIYISQRHQILIYDHGTGEIADFIIINETEREVRVEMVHVKAASESVPGDRVSYLYEVCGQAQKSVIWTQRKDIFIRKLNQRLDGKNHKIRVGDKGLLENILNKQKPIKYDIVVVQPGVSKNNLSEKMSVFLAATDDYIRKSGNNEHFKVICSQ